MDSANPAKFGYVSTRLILSDNIAVDREQNIWYGGEAFAHRYTPLRSPDGAGLRHGTWQSLNVADLIPKGRRPLSIAVDSRSPTEYFTWLGGGPSVVAVRASGPLLPLSAVTTAVGPDDVAGLGLDVDQNVWTVGVGGTVTRIKVTSDGAAVAPILASTTSQCPSGDQCALQTHLIGSSPRPAFGKPGTSFGSSNVNVKSGSYSRVVRGCETLDTTWKELRWSATRASGATSNVRVRTGNTPAPDETWSDWATLEDAPSVELEHVAPEHARFMQVEFRMTTTDAHSTPTLTRADISYECH